MNSDQCIPIKIYINLLGEYISININANICVEIFEVNSLADTYIMCIQIYLNINLNIIAFDKQYMYTC